MPNLQEDKVNMPSKNYTQDIVQKDKAHFMHPWTFFDVYKTEGALPIEKASGIHIEDTDGNKYLDAVGGLWCNHIDKDSS
jgi:adenosylmethionine-8-amino-7-oxononanoate aminotransferase